MLVYTFDRTLDGLLTAVFDAFALHQQPEMLVGEGGVLPLFTEKVHRVLTANDKAQRVWTGLEKLLSKEAVRVIAVSYLSEEPALDTPLFNYICKVFRQKRDISTNFADQDVLYVRNACRRVMHEQLRMKQFIRFQKAKDGTYLGVVSPDHNVLPLVVDHFLDRFNDQSWLIYDVKRHYGYYSLTPNPSLGGEGSIYSQAQEQAQEQGQSLHTPLTPERGVGGEALRITFEDEENLPFSLESGKLDDEALSENDKLFQDLWRTYFKAICIRERLNPKKQRSDMPRRYWKYMTEKQ
jgi:probable DNA metabolism protein